MVMNRTKCSSTSVSSSKHLSFGFPRFLDGDCSENRFVFCKKVGGEEGLCRIGVKKKSSVDDESEEFNWECIASEIETSGLDSSLAGLSSTLMI